MPYHGIVKISAGKWEAPLHGRYFWRSVGISDRPRETDKSHLGHAATGRKHWPRHRKMSPKRNLRIIDKMFELARSNGHKMRANFSISDLNLCLKHRQQVSFSTWQQFSTKNRLLEIICPWTTWKSENEYMMIR
jgi:hypothetical protein